MKHILLIGAAIILGFAFTSNEPEIDNDLVINYDGMYIGKTNEIQVGNQLIETYNYIRFYTDGTVICQSVGGYDPEAVTKWFHTGEGGRYERKGTYQLRDGFITFEVSNEGLPDEKIEGPRKDTYQGDIAAAAQFNLLCVYASGTMLETTYNFVKDTSE